MVFYVLLTFNQLASKHNFSLFSLFFLSLSLSPSFFSFSLEKQVSD
ncbi:hypothetical protein ACJIZ3_016850 [Penstemon smallii]|uniref:Uncharacterized protein n=1 Tax=Penstemon smallii TaxID=265156 RepID=A0ABD3SV01_9LAMI